MKTVLEGGLLLMRLLHPLLRPICFIAAWGLLGLTVWSLVSVLREAIARSRQLHQIPCAHCQFFTGNYTLKCTVHPSDALTEVAIGCRDYAPPEACPPAERRNA